MNESPIRPDELSEALKAFFADLDARQEQVDDFEPCQSFITVEAEETVAPIAARSTKPCELPTAVIREIFDARDVKRIEVTRPTPDEQREVRHLENRSVIESNVRRLLGDTGSNPLLEATVDWAVSNTLQAGRSAMHQLYDSLCETIESVGAMSGSLWLIDGGKDTGKGRVAPLVSYNNVHDCSASYEIAEDSPGVIVRAATSGSVTFVPNVHECSFYIPDVSGTVAELAIPLFSPEAESNIDQTRTVIGVLDLQFCSDPTVDDTSLVNESRRLASLFMPDLEVLDTLRRFDDQWCCYHPFVHSNSFRKPVADLCASVSQAIGSDHCSMTVWHADWEQKKLHAYATKGYDYQFRAKNLLHIDKSETGWVLYNRLHGAEVEFVRNPPGSFVMGDKAQKHSVTGAFIAPISSCDYPEATSDLLGCINIYFFRGFSKHYEMVEDALPCLAKFLGRLLSAYCNLRKRYFAESLNRSLLNPPERSSSIRSKLWILREFVDRCFSGGDSIGKHVVASSFWVRHKERLLCIEADRLLRLQPAKMGELSMVSGTGDKDPPILQDRWGPMYYDLSDSSHKGFTTFLAASNSKSQNPTVLRQRVHGSSGSPDFGIKPSGRFTEYFGAGVEFDRWFLGISVIDQNQNVIGVIRIVRPIEGTPFTRDDEVLLKSIALRASKIFEAWGHEFLSWSDKVRRESPEILDQVKSLL